MNKDMITYWEDEGLLLCVPFELKYQVALALDNKTKNIRNGSDFKDSPEDYEQFVINYLDEFFKENEEF